MGGKNEEMKKMMEIGKEQNVGSPHPGLAVKHLVTKSCDMDIKYIIPVGNVVGVT